MIPSKQQYKNWSLPSKYAFWGLAITILGFIGFLVVTYISFANQLTPAQIEELVSAALDKESKRAKEDGLVEPIDFTYYINEWAEKYGFDQDEVKTALDNWSNTESDVNDYRSIGLKLVYQQKFNEAAEYFEKAAQRSEIQLEEINKSAHKRRLAVFQNWRDAGNALQSNKQFVEALEKYNNAEKAISGSESNFNNQKFEIQFNIAATYGNIGISNPGEEGLVFIEQGYEIFNNVLEELIDSNATLKRIRVQENRSTLLRLIALHGSFQNRNNLLQEAENLIRLAIDYYKTNSLTKEWANAQNNLGLILKERGKVASGNIASDLFHRASNAHNEALSVFEVSSLKNEELTTRFYLGTVLIDILVISPRNSIKSIMSRCVSIFSSILDKIDAENMPRRYAASQNELGRVYYESGLKLEDPQFLSRAVSHFKYSLEKFTYKDFKVDWAQVQENLGSSLQELGIRASGPKSIELLNESIVYFDSALLVYRRDDFQGKWAYCQYLIGVSLKVMGKRTNDTQAKNYFLQSQDKHQLALEVFNKKEWPKDWGMVNFSLAVVYDNLRKQSTDDDLIHYINQSIKTCESALMVLKQNEHGEAWAILHNILGVSLGELAMRSSNPRKNDLLVKAISTWESAIEFYTENQFPEKWKMIKGNIEFAKEQLGN